jgi:hypothetical protein
VCHSGEGTQPRRLLYSYFTAGTGGVGPTILETSFLLAGEPTIAYKDGQKFVLPPVSERRSVDFGPGLGRRSAWLYNLPEVQTGFDVLRVPSVSARFGTSPAIWNLGMWLLARIAPKVRCSHSPRSPSTRKVSRARGNRLCSRGGLWSTVTERRLECWSWGVQRSQRLGAVFSKHKSLVVE